MRESCGQCTPCREGTGWLWRMVDASSTARAASEDLDLLLDVADNIEGRTICALGDAAAMPVQSFLKHFRDEFEYMIEHKRCQVRRRADLRHARWRHDDSTRSNSTARRAAQGPKGSR
jgi:NADH-quinone oxidoreductase subunit F